LKALGARLDRMTKEEVCRVLIQRGKTIPSVERRAFLAQFESVPPAAPERSPAHDDKRLIADVQAFIADLEKGKYYEGTGFDKEVRDYRSYGDESWVERMDALFDRAGAAFLNGNKATAAEAYGLLLHAFHMEDEHGHFCGATRATEMVATDLDEAKARYYRALYEIAPVKDRPVLVLKEMKSILVRPSILSCCLLLHRENHCRRDAFFRFGVTNSMPSTGLAFPLHRDKPPRSNNRQLVFGPPWRAF